MHTGPNKPYSIIEVNHMLELVISYLDPNESLLFKEDKGNDGIYSQFKKFISPYLKNEHISEEERNVISKHLEEDIPALCHTLHISPINSNHLWANLCLVFFYNGSIFDPNYSKIKKTYGHLLNTLKKNFHTCQTSILNTCNLKGNTLNDFNLSTDNIEKIRFHFLDFMENLNQCIPLSAKAIHNYLYIFYSVAKCVENNGMSVDYLANIIGPTLLRSFQFTHKFTHEHLQAQEYAFMAKIASIFIQDDIFNHRFFPSYTTGKREHDTNLSLQSSSSSAAEAESESFSPHSPKQVMLVFTQSSPRSYSSDSHSHSTSCSTTTHHDSHRRKSSEYK